MTTQLITLNDYRKNLSRIWKVSQEKNIRYIVLVHSRPVFEVNPIMSQDKNIDYGLYKLPEDEITPEIIASIEKAKKTPISEFHNL